MDNNVSGAFYPDVVSRRDRGAGTEESPYASITIANAAKLAGTAPALPWIVNSLAPCGMTQGRWDVGLASFVPRPGQCIAWYRGVNGAPLLDTTGAGRTLAVWLGVWSGAAIADWLLPNFNGMEINGVGEMSDPSSVATQKIRLALRGSHLLTGNEWDSMLGSGGATTVNTRGFGGVRTNHTRYGGNFRGVAGNGGASPSTPGQATFTGSFLAGSTAPHVEGYFGATTNILRVYSVKIWSA